jgi:hypothetical protein
MRIFSLILIGIIRPLRAILIGRDNGTIFAHPVVNEDFPDVFSAHFNSL